MKLDCHHILVADKVFMNSEVEGAGYGKNIFAHSDNLTRQKPAAL